jgi:uncharacterized protein (DUF3084 family)
MESALGVTLDQYMQRAPTYIGTSRGSLPQFDGVALSRSALAASIAEQLDQKSPRDAALTRRYFADMGLVFQEIYRVLKARHHAIIVVCPSHIRKTVIRTDEVFCELASATGLRLKHKYERTISERLRLLPYMKEAFGERMATEYVLIFQKAG